MEIAQDSGIVVVSTGGVESCGTTATALYFQPKGSAYSDAPVAGPNINWGAYKSDYSDRRGAMNVFQLKAGEYQVFARTIDANMVGKQIPKAEFSLSSGEILYLGEYYVSTPCSVLFHGEFRDQEERDFAILRQERPDLVSKPHSKTIPVFNGYLASPLDK